MEMEPLTGCCWEAQGVTLAPLPVALDLRECPHLQEGLAAAAHSPAEGAQRSWGHRDGGAQRPRGHRDGRTGKCENGAQGLGIQGPFEV